MFSATLALIQRFRYNCHGSVLWRMRGDSARSVDVLDVGRFWGENGVSVMDLAAGGEDRGVTVDKCNGDFLIEAVADCVSSRVCCLERLSGAVSNQKDLRECRERPLTCRHHKTVFFSASR